MMTGRTYPRTPQHKKTQIASIRESGQIEPVAVRLANPGERVLDQVMQGGEPIVCSGAGRVEYIRDILASGELFPGGPDIKTVLWTEDAPSAFLKGLHANIHRLDLNHTDRSLITSYGCAMTHGSTRTLKLQRNLV